jgi:hypothetical protein
MISIQYLGVKGRKALTAGFSRCNINQEAIVSREFAHMEPFEPIVIWDLEDDPDGNYVHIVVEHGVTQDEVWQVVGNRDNTDVPSDSSGRPSTFGWTQTGKYNIVVWEKVMDDPWTIYPVTAYEVPPPRATKKTKRRRR